MKIGTAPKITAGVIAIIALALIGSRQLLSPEDSTPSVRLRINANSTNRLPELTLLAGMWSRSRARMNAQISAEEMGQTISLLNDEADGKSKMGNSRKPNFSKTTMRCYDTDSSKTQNNPPKR